MAILAYHSLDDSGSVLSTSPDLFAAQMKTLYEMNIRVAPLTEVLHLLDGAGFADGTTAITFDDGFRNIFEYGLPVLHRYGFPATVFLVTDYCGMRNSWPSQPPSLKHHPLLGWSEVRNMNETGIAFGSHTRMHPDLRTLPVQDVEKELVDSKKAIEDNVGCAVNAFAYPYGAWDHRVKPLVQAHFTLACSTRLGFSTPESDPFALERLDMYYLRYPTALRFIFSREMHVYIRMRGGLRNLRRWLRGPGKRR